MKVILRNTSLAFQVQREKTVITPTLVAGQWKKASLTEDSVSARSHCAADNVVTITPDVPFDVQWGNGINNVAIAMYKKIDENTETWIADIQSGVKTSFDSATESALVGVSELLFFTQSIYDGNTALTSSDLAQLSLQITQ